MDWRAKYGVVISAITEAAEGGCRVIIESFDIISWKQRKLLNATCGDLSKQIRMNDRGEYVHVSVAPFGRRLSKDDWRGIFVAVALGQESVPHPDGEGFVMLSKSSKKLSKRAFDSVIQTIWAFGSARQVSWSDPEYQSAMKLHEMESGKP